MPSVQLRSDDLRPGTVAAIDIDGNEYVVWRGANGQLGSAPRQCPHLDHDLAEGWVEGNELVCPGHGWSFDLDGNALKRNEFGRVDPKGVIPTCRLREHDGIVEAEAP